MCARPLGKAVVLLLLVVGVACAPVGQPTGTATPSPAVSDRLQTEIAAAQATGTAAYQETVAAVETAQAEPSVTPWFGATPTQDVVAGFAWIRAVPCLNVRTEAEVGSILGCVADGTLVDILDDTSIAGWWFIQAPNGPRGWASAAYLERVSP